MNRLSTHPIAPLIALLAFVSFSLTACEVETDPPAYDEEPVRQTADSPVPESDEVIEINMSEFEFEPAEITIPAGEQVTLKFENVGSLTHEFMAGAELAEEGEGFKTGLFSDVEVHFRKNGEEIKQAADSTRDHAEGMQHEMAEDDSAHMEGNMQGDMQGNMEHEEHHGKMLYLEPGDVGSMTFTLPESKTGEYTFGCFESTDGTTHLQRGMRGTITVEAQAQAG